MRAIHRHHSFDLRSGPSTPTTSRMLDDDEGRLVCAGCEIVQAITQDGTEEAGRLARLGGQGCRHTDIAMR